MLIAMALTTRETASIYQGTIVRAQHLVWFGIRGMQRLPQRPFCACRRDGDASSARSTLADELYLEFDKEESPLTLDDMADTFINLLFAGHDTTAHTIARLLAELPRHPDVWDRLSQEQTAVSTS